MGQLTLSVTMNIEVVLYSLYFKLNVILAISHRFKNIVNVVLKRVIMSCFTKIYFVNRKYKVTSKGHNSFT